MRPIQAKPQIFELLISVSIEDPYFANDVTIFPNPNEGTFYVRFGEIREEIFIEVFDTSNRGLF